MKNFSADNRAQRYLIYMQLEKLKQDISASEATDPWEERQIQARIWDVQCEVMPDYVQARADVGLYEKADKLFLGRREEY